MSPSRPGLFAVLLASAACLVLAAPAASAGVTKATKPVVSKNFPDPGFAHFGKTYYLYGTTTSKVAFPVYRSTSATGGYHYVGSALTGRLPGWIGTASAAEGGGGHRLWAPDVHSYRFGTRNYYLMNFTAWDGAKHKNCLGSAVSSYPDHGFVVDKAPTLCAPHAGQEAIDPSSYLSAANNRYLVYKTSYGNKRNWTIMAVPVDNDGNGVIGTPKPLITTSGSFPAGIVEAPSVVLHDHRVLIFVSRNDYAGCNYATQVWDASSLFTPAKKFAPLKTILTRSSTGKCGPGGATVLGNGSYIAFHSWANGTPTSKSRWTYVRPLSWKGYVPTVG